MSEGGGGRGGTDLKDAFGALDGLGLLSVVPLRVDRVPARVEIVSLERVQHTLRRARHGSAC